MFGEDDDFFGDFDPNEQRFEDNFVDFERVGLGVDHPLLMNTKLGGMKDKNNLAKMQERFFKIYASDDEKFAHILEAVYYYYTDLLSPELGREDLINMLDAIYEFKNIYFKNPTCYLLGYYIVDQTSASIDRHKLKLILELIKTNPDISDIDIIRYCRLWIEKYNSE